MHAGVRDGIGTILVTGMIISTFFTLYFVPCIYTLLAAERERLDRRRAR